MHPVLTGATYDICTDQTSEQHRYREKNEIHNH